MLNLQVDINSILIQLQYKYLQGQQYQNELETLLNLPQLDISKYTKLQHQLQLYQIQLPNQPLLSSKLELYSSFKQQLKEYKNIQELEQIIKEVEEEGMTGRWWGYGGRGWRGLGGSRRGLVGWLVNRS